MRVLVTGHKGYIGAVLVPLLQEAGHEVVGLDSFLFADCTFGPDHTPVPSLRKDIRDVVASDLEGFDAVVHLAGISNDPLGDLSPSCTVDINHKASVRLARLAKHAGVARFLFASSCSTYGAAGDDLLDETAGFNPVTTYGVSKVLVEQEVTQLADANFSPTYLRPATAYGVSCRLRADLVLNNLVAWAFTTGRILLKSDGSPWRPLVHIEDISRAFLSVLEAPREAVHNQAFNVGATQENYRVRDVAEIVKQAVPQCRIEYADGAGPDKRCYRVDCDKIAKLLPGFRPRWNVRLGAQELVEAYERFGLTFADFQGAKYMRIETVKQLQREGRLDSTLRWTDQHRTPVEVQAKADARQLHRTITACRLCDGNNLVPFLSLGRSPLADALLRSDELDLPEPTFPLDVVFCPNCTLVQIADTVAPEVLFCGTYLYYSSFSEELLRHSRAHASSLIASRQLDSGSLVIEIASNDGYMLQNFASRGIPVLGIDPAKGPAQAAQKRGIRTLRRFFDQRLAKRLRSTGRTANVIIANNVLAHVPDLNGFVEGIRTLLHPQGVAAIEVPYLKDLIDCCEFDTIYHEHLFYFSVTALNCLFRRHGLFLNSVEHLPIHGGSLRLMVEHVENVQDSVKSFLNNEAAEKMNTIDYYDGFAAKVEGVRGALRELLIGLKEEKKRIAAYGAAAKGTTLINYADLGPDLLDFVVDRNTHKHGLYMPGKHLPIFPPAELLEKAPDYTLLLSWNFADEIMRQQEQYRQQGGKFIVPLPTLQVV